MLQRKPFWSRALHVFVMVVTVFNVSLGGVFSFTSTAAAAPNPAADLDQCANGSLSSPNVPACDPDEWVNGNLGESKAHYFEGDSVPYRLKFTNLSTVGTRTVTIEWDTTKSSKHALDYLTSFDRTVTTANPCAGVAGCSSSTTFPIPVDPQVSGAGVTPVAGDFTLFGGTITAVSAYSYPDGAGFSGDKSARISITFTADVANPVLAWGGHISDRHDWGEDNAAVFIPGSPYHMRLIDLDGSGGNQDRSLSAAAVIFPGSITIVKEATPEGSQTFNFTSDLGNFSLVDDGTAANTKLFDEIIDFQTYDVTETIPAGWSLDSIQCTDPTGGTTTSSDTASIDLDEGDNVQCTFANTRQAGSIIVYKNLDTDADGQADVLGVTDWTWDIAGGAQNTATGTGQTVDTGTHTISEDQQSGWHVVNLTCDDQDYGAVESGQVTVGLDETVACTFTNARDTGTLRVVKHVINDDGGNAAADDFTVHVYDNGTDVAGSPAPGSEAGTDYVLLTGTYTVGEDSPISGYALTSIVCDGQSTDTVTVTKDTVKTCTITNDDEASSITLIKEVINNNGGTAGANDFGLTIGGTVVNSGQTLTVDANTAYALDETGLFGYSFVSLTGDAKCPDALGGTVTLDEGESVTCTITNDDIAPELTVIKHVVNDNGGTAVASDFTMQVTGTNVSDDSFPGDEAGTTVTLNQGAYSVDEIELSGYTKSLGQDCSGTINVGETKTCTITNDDIAPELTVIKHVINDNGGNNVAADFTMQVTGTNVSDPSFPGDEAGTTVTLNQGAYSVDEIELSGYTKSLGQDCSGTINVGESKTCTITNDDDAPTITLVKEVINNSGGDAQPDDFGLTIGGSPATSGQSYPVDANTPYALDEAGLSGYAFVGLSGDAKCPAALGGTVTLDEGEDVTCTITNDDRASSITLIKEVINDNGGNAGENDFGLTIGGTAVDSGETLTVDSNTAYALNETGLFGYSFVSLTGDAKCPDVLGGTVTLDEGESVTCTITNDDIAPTITLHKEVINDNGGNAGENDFGLTIGGTAVNSGQTLDVDANTPYALDEAGLNGYSFVSLTGDELCPEALGGTVTLNEGESISCTITNDDQAPTITLHKEVINDDGGTAGINHFGLTIGGTAVNSGDTLAVTANTPIELNEAGLAGYTFVSLTGDEGCPSELGGTATLGVGEHLTCTITNDDIVPDLTIVKTNGVATFVNPGVTVDYTITVQNNATATDSAYNVVLTDELPDGFTYVGGSGNPAPDSVVGQTITWDLGDIAPGVSKAVTYRATVSAEQAAGFYTNVAAAQADNHDKVSDDSIVEVRVPVVLGEVTEPLLTIEKAVAVQFANPGDKVQYTITVKNIGNGVAENVTVTDTLPAGFTYGDGAVTKTWLLGDMQPDEEKEIAYTVIVSSSQLPGTYINVAVARADNHDPVQAKANLEVRVPQVLAETGIAARDLYIVLNGLALMVIGAWLIVRPKRRAA